jgi:hypothetical protein
MSPLYLKEIISPKEYNEIKLNKDGATVFTI